MKKAVWLAVIFVLTAATSSFAADAPKIGFVDMARALNDSDAGKKAKADLEFLLKSKQSAIEEKVKAIEKIKADIDKQSSVLSQDARKSKEDEMERLIREYQRFVTDSENELKKKQGELTIEIGKELRVIIQNIGQNESYLMIFENSDNQILYSRNEADLTDIVVKKHNESKAKPKK